MDFGRDRGCEGQLSLIFAFFRTAHLQTETKEGEEEGGREEGEGEGEGSCVASKTCAPPKLVAPPDETVEEP